MEYINSPVKEVNKRQQHDINTWLNLEHHKIRRNLPVSKIKKNLNFKAAPSMFTVLG